MICNVGLLVILTVTAAIAQDVAGTWMAIPSDSGGLRHAERLVLKLNRDNAGVLAGSAYGGRFGDQYFRFTSISFSEAKLTVVMESAGSTGARNSASTGLIFSFTGTLSSDDKSIAGWIQGPGFNERLKFSRVGKAPVSKAPPTPASAPASPADPSTLLTRALARLSGTNRQLLKYTCLETIDRSYLAAPARKPENDIMTEALRQSCDGRSFSHPAALTLDAEDRLRLEVAVADGKEIDSWASASSFDSRSIHDVVSTGPTATGAFGTALVDIFENPGAHYTFLSQKNDGTRVVFVYSFDVPVAASNYRVQAAAEWRKTAYHGTFEVDAATAELTRLVSETAALPTEAKACRYRTSTDYHYETIGNGRFLIPQHSDFDVLLPNGNEDRSAIVFSGCHEYQAESSLSFNPEESMPAANSAPKSAPPLPPGLDLTLALANSIDSRTAAAGDAISAKVAKAVRAPGSDAVLVAAGAIAHGRIVQMRQELETGHFLIVIRYDTLEQNGSVAPLSVRLDRELKAEQAQSRNRLSSRGAEFSLPSPGVEPGTWFTLASVDGHATLAAGSETKWITVAK
jgi:hypothetical protein